MIRVVVLGILLGLVGFHGPSTAAAAATSSPSSSGGDEAIMEAIKCPLCHYTVDFLARRVMSLRRQCAANSTLSFCDQERSGDVSEAEVINLITSFCNERVLHVFPAITEHRSDDGDAAAAGDGSGNEWDDDDDADAAESVGGDASSDDGQAELFFDDLAEARKHIRSSEHVPDAIEPVDARFHPKIKKACEAHVLRKTGKDRSSVLKQLLTRARSPDIRRFPTPSGGTEGGSAVEGGGKATQSKVPLTAYRQECARQRREDFRVVAGLQEALCAKACGHMSQDQDKREEPRIIGWNVFGHFIDPTSFDEL